MAFFDTSRPLVFAHRGGCDLGPENTLATFDAGLAAGADGLELDVHLSSDGIVVVHHDTMLDRTTWERGPVAVRRAADLTSIEAGRECAAVRPMPGPLHERRGVTAGEQSLTTIPTLRQVLTRYPATPVIIEMKVDSAAMGLAVAREIQELGAIHRVCAAGFGLHSLRAVREALPGLATSASQPEVRLALYRSWAHWPVRHAAYGAYQVPEHAGRLRVVSPRFIRHAHQAGLKVQIWTVDEESDMQRLLEWGADALISNRPDLAVRVRDRFLASRAHPHC